MKHAVATCSGDDQWRNMRPPLVKLDRATGDKVMANLQAFSFDMPGCPRS